MKSIQILPPELDRVRELRRRWYAGMAAQRELAGLLDSIVLAAVEDPGALDQYEVKLVGDNIILQPITAEAVMGDKHDPKH